MFMTNLNIVSQNWPSYGHFTFWLLFVFLILKNSKFWKIYFLKVSLELGYVHTDQDLWPKIDWVMVVLYFECFLHFFLLTNSKCQKIFSKGYFKIRLCTVMTNFSRSRNCDNKGPVGLKTGGSNYHNRDTTYFITEHQ